MGIRYANHMTSFTAEVGTNFADKRGRSIGIARSSTKATD
jgi:hypothetical protein